MPGRIRRLVPAIALLLMMTGTVTARDPIAGVVQLENGKTVEFTDVASLVFSLPEGAESIPQNVNEWPFVYESSTVSRSAPLAWLKSITVLKHEVKPAYRCIFNPVISIETVTGVLIESQLKTLEWIRVKLADGEERTLYFAHADQIQIRKIVFRTK